MGRGLGPGNTAGGVLRGPGWGSPGGTAGGYGGRAVELAPVVAHCRSGPRPRWLLDAGCREELRPPGPRPVTGSVAVPAAMGRRKSKRKPPPKKKVTGTLETQFTCPFCNHEKSCDVKM